MSENNTVPAAEIRERVRALGREYARRVLAAQSQAYQIELDVLFPKQRSGPAWSQWVRELHRLGVEFGARYCEAQADLAACEGGYAHVDHLDYMSSRQRLWLAGPRRRAYPEDGHEGMDGLVLSVAEWREAAKAYRGDTNQWPIGRPLPTVPHSWTSYA